MTKGSKMTELRIDGEKAERIASQVLRDDGKLTPAKANELAATICRRISTSMPLPSSQQLQNYRMISSFPGTRLGGIARIDEFADALQKKVGGDIEDSIAREVWKLVWEMCEDLPAGVADAARL